MMSNLQSFHQFVIELILKLICGQYLGQTHSHEDLSKDVEMQTFTAAVTHPLESVALSSTSVPPSAVGHR